MIRRTRIFIGYHEMAGYCRGLEAALRTAGARPHFCETLENDFYQASRGTRIERAMRAHFAPGASRQCRGACGWRIKGRLLKALFFLELLLRYDAYIFVDRYSPLGIGERALLRAFGKKVVSVFLGSDSRPLFQSGAYWDRFKDDHPAMERETRRQFEEIRTIERGSDVVVCHALCAHFLSKPFARLLAVGFPFDGSRIEDIRHENAPRPADGRLHVIHAPSKPKFKGTAAIMRAIEELQEEGLQIKLDLIQNMPNRAVLEALADCDFVVDELYSDVPLAGLAVEAAAFGKPAVVGTYTTPEELLEPDLPPSALCAPSAIKESIRSLATDKVFRDALGSHAKAYLETQWSSSNVGERFIRLVSGEADPVWFSDPSDTTYMYGWGIEAEELRRHLREFVRSRGTTALCFEDKPRVLSAVESFIGGNPDSIEAH